MQKGARLLDDLTIIKELFGGSGRRAGATAAGRAAAGPDRLGDPLPLEQALTLLDRALIDASEAEDAMEAAAEALNADPARLEAVETRLFDLRALARKHQTGADDLAALAEDLAAKLSRIEAGEEGLAALEQAERTARADYEDRAHALSVQRQDAAALLDKAVAGELAPLKLDAAKFLHEH